jgi:LacI family transcriptional regulator
MADVADHVGVSKATVSLVFRQAPGVGDDTRAAVMAAADELGYRVNRTAALMTARRTHLIGAVAQIRNSFHAELVEQLVRAADAAGYEIVLGAVTPTHGENRVVDTLLDFRCEAMLLIGTELPDAQIGELATRVPTVAVGRRVGGPDVDAVRTDDAQGIAQVVDHLYRLGHRRIVHVSGGSGAIAADRRAGFLRALRSYDLAHSGSVIESDGFTEAAGMTAGHSLLAGDLPTAVVCANDLLAVGALDVLRSAGVAVPEQVSITGYDDSPLARLGNVALTTVSQRPAEQADRAIAAVIERLDRDRTERSTATLTPELVVRATTGPAQDSTLS